MSFIGHIKRHDRLEKTILEGKLEGKRKRGKPRRVWTDDMNNWLEMSVKEVSSVATKLNLIWIIRIWNGFPKLDDLIQNLFFKYFINFIRDVVTQNLIMLLTTAFLMLLMLVYRWRYSFHFCFKIRNMSYSGIPKFKIHQKTSLDTFQSKQILLIWNLNLKYIIS